MDSEIEDQDYASDSDYYYNLNDSSTTEYVIIEGNGDVDLIEPDWSLYWMVNMGLTGAMASVSLLANSVLVVTVFRLAPMRRSGYFQIMVAFAIANMLYFSVNLVYRGLMTLSAVSVIPGGGVLATIIGKWPWIIQALTDVIHCLLGLQMWLMCLLAIEVRMSITFYLMNKEGFVRGVRYTILAVTLFVALAAFITVCLLRHDEGFRTFSTLSNGGNMTTVCVVYAVYILVFTVTPIFMVVLIGVSNCVALAGSTRHRHPVQRLAMRLDRRLNVVSTFILALMLIHFTRQMAQEVQQKPDVSILVSSVLHLLVDLLLLVIPCWTLSGVGHRSCCCPSKRCCPDAIEKYGDEIPIN